MNQQDRLRLAAGLALALGAGVVVGRLDSSPGWDDTAVTVGLLLGSSAVAAAVAGRFPWIVAIATGMFVPIFGWSSGSGGGLVALLFSSVGAAIGWLIVQGDRGRAR